MSREDIEIAREGGQALRRGRLGDRLVVLGVIRLSAHTTGINVEQEFGQLITLRDGLVAHEYSGPMRWKDALRAAELDPDLVSSSPRR